MTTEQAYINGFVKRAMEHGFTDNEAIEILKEAGLPISRKSPKKVKRTGVGPRKAKPVREEDRESRIRNGIKGTLTGLLGGGVGGYYAGKEITEKTAGSPASRKSRYKKIRKPKRTPDDLFLTSPAFYQGALGGGAAGAVGGGAAGALVGAISKKDKEKKAYELGLIERAKEHGFTDNEAVKILKQASPQSAASFMENYKAMPPTGQQNLATNPNVNPVAHQQMLSGMNWQGRPMMDKAKALFTPGHTQNIANRAVRAGTGMARSLAGDNPANVAANFKQITAPQPNRAMLQEIK